MNSFIEKAIGLIDTFSLWINNFFLMIETAYNFVFELLAIPVELMFSVPPILGFSVGLTMVIFVIRFLLLK